MTTAKLKSSPKAGNKATTKEMTQRVQGSMKDLNKVLEREQLKDSKKSDVVNSSNSMGDTLDSLENCLPSILELDKALDKVSDSEKSIQEQIQEICFTSNGEINELGVDSIVDYATRLKNLSEGVSTHINFKKLDVLRKQFERAFKWAKENDFIGNDKRLSLVGVGKKMTQMPDTNNPYRELTVEEKAKQDKALKDAEKSKQREELQLHVDWFVSLTDKEFDKYSKERNEFKLMRNDTATKKTVTKEVKK
jgi:hypothetical protein